MRHRGWCALVAHNPQGGAHRTVAPLESRDPVPNSPSVFLRFSQDDITPMMNWFAAAPLPELEDRSPDVSPHCSLFF